MIDHATLPDLPEHTSLTVGQQFVVRGLGFDRWPSEIVLSLSDYFAENGSETGINVMKLVSKTNVEMVFEVSAAHEFAEAHIWSYFASPYAAPRSLLVYDVE